MTTKLRVINGGRSKLTSHIYEICDSEGYIVDVLRFNTGEEAAKFQSELNGDYYVKPHTLTVEELLEVVMDLRMDEILSINESEIT